jgi:hypothetical protein
MDGQRSSSSRRRNRKRSGQDNQPSKPKTREAPVLIAARRPNAPAVRPQRRFLAASATPRQGGRQSEAGELHNEETAAKVATKGSVAESAVVDVPRRAARIVQANVAGPDERENERLRLIGKLLRSEGRVAISRAANDLTAAGFDFPVAQDVQLQLLEHFDEGRAYQALQHLSELLKVEPPIKRPLFEQRLRRLEESADETATRETARELRRVVRA